MNGEKKKSVESPGRGSWLLRWPARLLLPVLMLLFALAVSLLGHRLRVSELDASVLQTEQQRLRERLALEQGRLTQATGQGDMGQARRLVAGLALHEGLMQAWLIEEDGRIAAALSRAEIGRRLSTVLIALPPAERDALMRENGALTHEIQALIAYMNATLLGVVAGTVPPWLEIPYTLHARFPPGGLPDVNPPVT